MFVEFVVAAHLHVGGRGPEVGVDAGGQSGACVEFLVVAEGDRAQFEGLAAVLDHQGAVAPDPPQGRGEGSERHVRHVRLGLQTHPVLGPAGSQPHRQNGGGSVIGHSACGLLVRVLHSHRGVLPGLAAAPQLAVTNHLQVLHELLGGDLQLVTGVLVGAALVF